MYHRVSILSVAVFLTILGVAHDAAATRTFKPPVFERRDPHRMVVSARPVADKGAVLVKGVPVVDDHGPKSPPAERLVVRGGQGGMVPVLSPRGHVASLTQTSALLKATISAFGAGGASSRWASAPPLTRAAVIGSIEAMAADIKGKMAIVAKAHGERHPAIAKLRLAEQELAAVRTALEGAPSGEHQVDSVHRDRRLDHMRTTAQADSPRRLPHTQKAEQNLDRVIGAIDAAQQLLPEG